MKLSDDDCAKTCIVYSSGLHLFDTLSISTTAYFWARILHSQSATVHPLSIIFGFYCCYFKPSSHKLIIKFIIKKAFKAPFCRFQWLIRKSCNMLLLSMHRRRPRMMPKPTLGHDKDLLLHESGRFRKCVSLQSLLLLAATKRFPCSPNLSWKYFRFRKINPPRNVALIPIDYFLSFTVP